MNYQGILLQPDGSVPPDGPVTLGIAIYDQPQGGVPLWQETIATRLEGSVFDVELGTMSAIDLLFNKPYYIGISVNGGSELTPRTPCTTTPYAFRAIYADTAGIATDLDSNAKVVRSLNGMHGNITIRGVNITVTTQPGLVELRIGRIPLDSVDFPVGTRAGQALIWNGTRWIADDLPTTTFIAGRGIDIRGDTIGNTGDVDPLDDVLFSTQAGGDITGTFLQLRIAQKGATPGEALMWNGTEWMPSRIPAVVLD
ncbi:MAG: hypothetical protein FGM24_09965, partial [Candidatus Kapabacteria bacterium]|nr:hypothetical protein [Candidatus Kapabacteria bacterium]